MTQYLRLIYLYILSLFLAPLCWAQTSNSLHEGTRYRTDAPHAILMDYETGSVLYEKDARMAIPPSSMTKIMTAHIVFDEIKSGRLSLDDTFTVSEEAKRRGGVKSGSSTMFLESGSEVSVKDLLYGVIIQSGNDACITLAEGIAGSERAFARLMNEKAKALGLNSAYFVNATGWPDDGHVISLFDLAKLARATIHSHPDFYDIYAQPSFRWNGITQNNRNPLLGAIEGADGLKTGATSVAGFGLVGSAKRDETRRIMVINGLENRFERRRVARSLMESSFHDFEIKTLRVKGQRIGQAGLYLGAQESVDLVTPANIQIGHVIGEYENIKVTLQTPKETPAPIEAGQIMGELIVDVPGQPLKSFPVVAERSVKAKSGISKALAVLARKISKK